ncbi:transporter substrate-binding domain-containing protein [Holzapfeliella sp. He02]|uniref:Transporter substrate-binding domain-containing protein n=1 Tax=Holzapfeliella saturejae TaxID=3082953 RepID=A0ABU8SEA8_9LACO
MPKVLKKLGALAVILTLGLLITACGQSLAQQSVVERVEKTKTITWGVKGDQKLFSLINVANGQYEGFEGDLAQLLSKKAFGDDVKVEFATVTSSSRVPMLKNGNVDALISTMTITPARQQQLDFTEPYFNAGQSLLVKKGSPITNVKDLDSSKTVLGMQGSSSVQTIKKSAPEAKVLELSDLAQAFTALKSGQGDALTSDNGILYGLAASNPDYEVVGGAFTTEPYGIAANKGQEDLINKLNEALKVSKSDGSYDELINKWFGSIPGFEVSQVK